MSPVPYWKYPGLFLLSGLVIGTGIRSAYSEVSTPQKQDNPNVVVLRSEKQVTIAMEKVTLAEIAGLAAKQTGYQFTLDKPYSDDKTTYAVLVRNLPLSRLLGVTSYLSGGIWERHDRRYRLRPRTPEEQVQDATRFEATVLKVQDYLRDLDWRDPGLPLNVQNALGSWQSILSFPRHEFPLLQDGNLDNWTFVSGKNKLAVGYTTDTASASGRSGTMQFRSWSWTDPVVPQ